MSLLFSSEGDDNYNLYRFVYDMFQTTYDQQKPWYPFRNETQSHTTSTPGTKSCFDLKMFYWTF